MTVLGFELDFDFIFVSGFVAAFSFEPPGALGANFLPLFA